MNVEKRPSLSADEYALLLDTQRALSYRAMRKGDDLTITWAEGCGRLADITAINEPMLFFGSAFQDWERNALSALQTGRRFSWEHPIRLNALTLQVRHTLCPSPEGDSVVGMLQVLAEPPVYGEDYPSQINLLNALPVGICLIDYDFRVLWANSWGASHAGFDWKLHYGEVCYKASFGLDDPCLNCPVAATLADGRLHSSELLMPWGETWHILSVPAIDRQGKQIGAIEIVIDTSKQAEERKQTIDLMNRQKQRLSGQVAAMERLHNHYSRQDTWFLKSPGAVTETIVKTLGNSSARFWVAEENGNFTCLDQYDLATDTHPSFLPLPDFMQVFFKTRLSDSRQITISNVLTANLPDDVTAYYLSCNVHSLLFAPIRANSRFEGFITMAHFSPREWQVEEQSFTMAVANFISLCLHQHRLEEKKRQLDTLLSNLPGAAFRMRYAKDGSAEFEYLSEGNDLVGGFNIEEALEDPDIMKRMIFSEDYEMYHDLHAQPHAVGETVELLFRFFPEGGRLRWVFQRCRVIEVNEEAGVTTYEGFGHDVTERILLREAELANDAKSKFLSSMSHEIRTPLNAIIGFTHLFQNTTLTDDQRNYIEKLQYSANMLLKLINTILDFSKIEAGKLEIVNAPFSLSAMLKDVDAMLREAASRKSLAFRIETAEDVPDNLVGDELHLKQVLINLTNNAIKFTATGRVTLKCSIDTKLNDGLLLSFAVIDTGIGMDEEELEQIFTPFVQADTTITRTYGGTGLGLTIVKSLVDLMGGTISVQSATGKGSTFTFTSRLGISGEDTLPDEDYTVPMFKGQNILLVEDNEINREIAIAMLKDVNLNVIEAENGQIALDILHTEHENIELVLMDIQMPVMDGLQATRLIRATPETAKLPIVAMTALALTTEREKCRVAGMNRHITKPIEIRLFYDTLAEFLAHER